MASTPSTFGRTIFGRDLFGYGSSSDSLPSDIDLAARPRYVIEVLSPSQALKARLLNWRSGQFEEQYNEADSLQFTYPLGDDKSALLVDPNLLALRENGVLRQVFKIAKRRLRRGADGLPIVSITAEDLSAELGLEMIDLYETVDGNGDPETRSCGTILSQLLNENQNNALVPDISVGEIESAIANVQMQFKAEKQTIGAALDRIHQRVGGFYHVDAHGRLNWFRTPRSQSTLRLRSDRNLSLLESEIDYRAIRTRVVAVGRLDGTDAAEQETHLTSVATNKVSTHGQKTAYIDAKTVKTAAQLDDIANARVKRLSTPRITTTAEAIDLQKHPHLDIRTDEVELGMQCEVGDSELGVAIRPMVGYVKHDLASPSSVAIKVTDPNSASPDAATDASDGDTGAQGPIETTKDDADRLADLILSLARRLDELALEDFGLLDFMGEAIENSTTLQNILNQHVVQNIQTILEQANVFLGATLVEVDIDAVNARTGLSPGDPDYILKFEEGFTAFTTQDKAIYAWAGNPSDDASPGDWDKITGTYRTGSDVAALGGAPEGTRGVTQTSPKRGYVYADGDWRVTTHLPDSS